MIRKLAIAGAVAILGGCAQAPANGEFHDPYEAQNRHVHEINKDLDRTVVRPVSRAYAETVPWRVRSGVNNFASNLDLPGLVLNDLLQFRLDDAFHNTARFLLNSTVGVAGLFDPAGSIDLYKRETDFGETMHVWGVGEGAYVELPLLGPSTERDTVGKAVDFALNPTRLFLPADIRTAGTVAGAAELLNDRDQYSELIDSVLYDSADSYAQARLLYLQNRRFVLDGASEPDYQDVYEDPYAE